MADVGDQLLGVLVLLDGRVAAGHVHQRQHEAGLAQADELLVGKDLQLLLVHPAPQQGVEHPLPGVGGDGHHALPVAVAFADEPPDALQDVVDLIGVAAGALDHLADGADGPVVLLRQPVRHPDEQQPQQRQPQHGDDHRAQKRRREGRGGGVDAVLQPGGNHAVRREGVFCLLTAGEEGLLPVQHAEARRVRQRIPGHGLQPAQLQQHQHRALGGAAVGVGGVVEGGVIVGVDQVFLVHHDAARTADAQQLRYGGHPDVGPLRQQGAFSLHGDHRPGGVQPVVVLEGEHQRIQVDVGGGALDALELVEHLVQLHGVDGAALHVDRLQDAAAVLRGVDGGAHVLGRQQLLIHPGAPGVGLLLHLPFHHLPVVGGIRHQVRGGVHPQKHQDDQHIGQKQPDKHLAVKVGGFVFLHVDLPD